MAGAEDVPREAEKLLGKKQYRDAVELLTPWVRENPDHVHAWELLGGAHYELQQWAEAADATARVMHLSPDDPSAWSNWGTTLRKLRNFDDARDAQQRALALDPAYERAQTELRKIDRDAAGPDASERPPASAPSNDVPRAKCCPVCGSPVRPGARICLTCRTDIQPDASTTRQVCPACGAAVLVSDHECVNCGADIAAERYEAALRAEAAQTEADNLVRHSDFWSDLAAVVPAFAQAVAVVCPTLRQEHVRYVGLVGSALLFIGVFLPFVGHPGYGSLNYIGTGQRDGVIILVSAVVSAALTLHETRRWLWITGLGSLGLLAFFPISVRTSLERLGFPYDAWQLEYGFAVLVVGGLLLIVAAAARTHEEASSPAETPEEDA